MKHWFFWHQPRSWRHRAHARAAMEIRRDPYWCYKRRVLHSIERQHYILIGPEDWPYPDIDISVEFPQPKRLIMENGNVMVFGFPSNDPFVGDDGRHYCTFP